MYDEPDFPDLPSGHPIFTETIHPGLEEVAARLTGASTFVDTVLNQADLFADQGNTQAVVLALGEAITYFQYSRDAAESLEDFLDDQDDDREDDPQEDDDQNELTLYRTVSRALEAADQCSQRITEAVDRHHDAIWPNEEDITHLEPLSLLPIQPQEATLLYIRAATQTLEYHIKRTQEETASTQTRHAHSLVAEGLGFSLQYELNQHEAQLTLNRNLGHKTTRMALQNAARQAKDALSKLASTQKSRQQLMPIICSDQIDGQPHLKEEAELIAQRCREGEDPYIIHLPNQPDPDGVMIAYRHEGTILVKTMEEPYPKHFPDNEAEDHAIAIQTMADDYPPEQVEDLMHRAAIQEQAAVANIHTIPLQTAKELVLMVLKATGQRDLALQAADIIAGEGQELAEELARPVMETENPVSLQQARNLMEKTQQAGIPTPVARQIAEAMGYEPQDLGIKPLQVPWKRAERILEAAGNIHQDELDLEGIASILNIDVDGPKYTRWAERHMPEELEDWD